MDQPPQRSQGPRDSMLAVALAVLGAGIFLFYLDFIMFGLVGSVLSMFAIIAFVGAMHYLVWGHALSKEVAPGASAAPGRRCATSRRR